MAKSNSTISIRDVAHEAGVSVSTVSRALNQSGYVSAENRERINNAVKKLHYVPNSVARSLVMHNTGIIGVIFPNISSPFLAGLAQGLEQEAAKHGYSVLSCYSKDDVAQEKEYARILRERRADGLIVMPAGSQQEHFEQYDGQIPVVFLIRGAEGGKQAGMVTPDNMEGSYRLTKYMIDKGHTKIALLAGNNGFSTAKERYHGYAAAMKAAGLDIREELIGYGGFTGEGGQKAMLSILQRTRPTAVLASSSLMCVGAMHVLNEKGLRIPDDISVCSFDGFDDSYLKYLLPPVGITSNRLPLKEMGQSAMQMLFDKIQAEKNGEHTEAKHITVQGIFDERGSVKSLK
ncbi:LacI family transcriptional regulator [Clostridia bacterium OttesenSCG-928-F22]|nr:LacI family transcriptional regulator [Clostridia bacterium OttesenSCG-928-F22]